LYSREASVRPAKFAKADWARMAEGTTAMRTRAATEKRMLMSPLYCTIKLTLTVWVVLMAKGGLVVLGKPLALVAVMVSG
jgi:hypothetical protein